jgi:membrane peptidoglycan carboxypeptidase
MYLNTAYFGNGAFGIERAAEKYFGKTAENLDLSESSYLAGLLTSPAALSPYSGNKEAAEERQELVLKNMLKLGMINDEEYSQAKSKDLAFQGSGEDINTIAPHFALAVRDQLIKKYGEDEVAQSGFVVKTTLNRKMQEEATQVLKSNESRLVSAGGSNGSIVAMDPKNGEVKAYVGSIDWNNDSFGKIDMVTSPRQPGSSFKPFVYAEALSEGLITPATILKDRPTTFRIPGCNYNCDYKPHDYDFSHRGDVTVRRALSNSLNIPAVEVMQRVGVESVLEKTSELGITSLSDNPEDYGLSLVLGAGNIPLIQMVGAYGAFANYGEFIQPTLISAIKDKNGKKVSLGSQETSEVWTPGIAFLISSILSDKDSRKLEFGNLLDTRIGAAVKTGTSEDYRDDWTIGYIPDLVLGVWVGNDDNSPMKGIPGSLGAGPIWKQLMNEYTIGMDFAGFIPPPSVVRVASCKIKDDSASGSAVLKGEYFVEGTEPGDCVEPPKNIAETEDGLPASASADFGIGGPPPDFYVNFGTSHSALLEQ